MRVHDRRWWLRALWAICLLVSSGLFAVWYFQHILPLDRAFAIPAYRDAILAAVICFMLIVLAIYTALGALTARHRYHARLATIHGDHNAIPISRLADELSPVLTYRPLPVIANNSPARRTAITAVLGFVFLLGILIFLLASAHFVSFLQYLIFISRMDPIYPYQAVSNHLPLLDPIPYFGGLALLFLFNARDTSGLRRIPYLMRRITITSDGITCVSAWGASRTIFWHDARLFEVAYQFAPPAQTDRLSGFLLYTLHGTRSTLRWTQRFGVPIASSDPFLSIAPMVARHTSLVPRSFDVRLRELSQTTSPDTEVVRSHILRIASCAAVLLASSTLIGTDQQGLVMFSLFALSVAGFTVSTYGTRARKRQHDMLASPLLATAPTNASTEQGSTSVSRQQFAAPLYEMTVGSYPLFVFNQIVFALMGAAAALAALGILGAEFAQYVLHVPGLHLYSLPPLFALSLVLLLLAGILTIIVSIRARDTIVLADLTGVRKRWLLGNTFIPWGDIERIEVRFIAGRPTYYRVFGHGGRPAFAWPARPFQPSPKPQEPGATLTNPANMAAIVAQRSGKPILPGPPRLLPL
ncbi:MAG: hypothetical protein OJF49_003820 [Ktedonobacterales bacterium]|nr:MAG: hypothetical protein OJF49_003820 [Ktedonobacterales bacterium]